MLQDKMYAHVHTLSPSLSLSLMTPCCSSCMGREQLPSSCLSLVCDDTNDFLSRPLFHSVEPSPPKRVNTMQHCEGARPTHLCCDCTVDSQQLHLEGDGGVGRDDRRGTCWTVRIVRRAHQGGLLPFPHSQQPFIPPPNDAPLTDDKAKGLTTRHTAVEYRTTGEQITRVVDLHVPLPPFQWEYTTCIFQEPPNTHTQVCFYTHMRTHSLTSTTSPALGDEPVPGWEVTTAKVSSGISPAPAEAAGTPLRKNLCATKGVRAVQC